MTDKTLGEKLAKLAEKVVDEALGHGTPLEAMLDALKTVGAYHLAATKATGKPQDNSGESNFGKYAEKIKNAEKENQDDE